MRRWLTRLVAGAVLVAVVLAIGTAFRVWQVARVDDRAEADVIVVLGAAQYNGEPSPIFAARLEHARQLRAEGVAQQIVTAGGKLADDAYTEAEAGARWLVDNGVPESDTIVVGHGSDTLTSMEAVADVAAERDLSSAVIVSDPWHSLRARTMADEAGLEATTSPARSGPIVQTRKTQIRYIWRETQALLYHRLLKAPADDTYGAGL